MHNLQNNYMESWLIEIGKTESLISQLLVVFFDEKYLYQILECQSQKSFRVISGFA